MNRLIACFVLLAVILCIQQNANAGSKSDSKVKASAVATRVDAAGKQIVTVTLDIDKGWYIFAHPVNAKLRGVLQEEWLPEFKISIHAEEKLTANINYPAGRVFKTSDRYEYDTYEGRIVVTAEVQRKKEDMSPLHVKIYVDATNRKYLCLMPAVIKLTIPQQGK